VKQAENQKASAGSVVAAHLPEAYQWYSCLYLPRLADSQVLPAPEFLTQRGIRLTVLSD
jgi:hypothetical protein